jgi:hypothetical protein
MFTRRRRNGFVATSAARTWPPATSALFLAAVVVPSVLFFLFLRAPFVLPSMSMASLATAGLLAWVAWWRASERDSAPINLWDVSCAYAFIGLSTGILSEPEQMMQFWTVPTDVQEAAR